MKKIKKFVSLVLCVCMTGYAFPVFASQNVNDSELDVQVIVLSDTEMNELVGASGNLDVNVSDYHTGDAEATVVFANRSGSHVDYVINGGSYVSHSAVLGSGNISPNSAIIVTVPVVDPAVTWSIQGVMTVSGTTLEAVDVSNR